MGNRETALTRWGKPTDLQLPAPEVWRLVQHTLSTLCGQVQAVSALWDVDARNVEPVLQRYITFGKRAFSTLA